MKTARTKLFISVILVAVASPQAFCDPVVSEYYREAQVSKPAPKTSRSMRTSTKCALVLGGIAASVLVTNTAVMFGRAIVQLSAASIRSVYPHGSWEGHRRLNWGSLSPLWAQEYTGADFARIEMLRTKDQLHLSSIPVGVWDAGFESDQIPKSGQEEGDVKNGLDLEISMSRGDVSGHGSAVSFLIAGETKSNGSPVANLEVMTTNGFPDEYMDFYQEPYLPHSLKSKAVRLVNISLGIGGHEVNRSGIKKLSDDGIVFVVGAGNLPSFDPSFFNLKSHYDWKYGTKNIHLPAIIVGSIAPNGEPSDFSNPGLSVAISAPSDKLLRVENEDGNLLEFGGTSGAAPQVTAAIANLMALLPGITLDEIKILLKRTALVTLDAQSAIPSHGAGSLNSYKLVLVGERLKAAGWPMNREKIINEEHHYDFSVDATKYLEIAKSHEDKGQQAEALANYRRSFLLKPMTESQKALSRIYREVGLTDNATFFESIQASRTN